MLIANRRCIVIKFAGDTRYDSKSGSGAIMTHSGNVFNECKIVIVKTLAEIPTTDIETADVIGISEGQFYEDVVEYANKFANSGKSVIIEGLSGDFEQKPFATISNLIPTVDTITHFNAICTQCCDDNAPFTTRISNDKEKVIIGGADKYKASCRQCILKSINDKPSS
jgi:thymidine kinase